MTSSNLAANVPAVDPVTGRSPRVCPLDLRPLEEVPDAKPEDVRRAVELARRAAEGWAGRSIADRAAALRKAAKAMLARTDEVLALVKDEMGKLECEGLFNEALGHLDMLEAWVGVVEKGAGREKIRMNPLKFLGKSAHIDLVPRGVIGIIAPWNFPIAGLYRSIYPALLTGNGVVLKPSEHTPRSSQWFADALAQELPDGLISVVHGAGGVGQALIEAGIDACVFTGSTTAGKLVQVRCAERGIPCSVEMGGKDMAIVLADCDLDRTCAGLTHWALANVGQSCGALEVALVEETIADELVSRLQRAWEHLKIGPAEHADLSPLANRKQFEVVVAQVEDARQKGARILCGGKPTGVGFFYPATLIDRCTEEMAVVKDETFGPVLAIVRVASAAEAVRVIKRCRYGLGASIWTKDVERAAKLAEQVDAGVVVVNNHSFTGAVPELPWSGTKDTGFGIANSHHALLTFCRPRAVVVDKSSGPEPFWMPFDRDLAEMGRLLIDAQLFKVERAWKLPLLMRRRAKTIKEFFRR
ncbi:MAG: aldehyde dehydrogenase family protein [Myxococcales bacterium]